MKKQYEPLVFFFYLLFGAFLLSTSWLRWPDPWVDFGLTLQNVWTVSEGGLPGRDIIYYYGPLALLFYGALFKVFGASISLLYWVNALLLVVDTFLIHKIFRRFSFFTAVMATTCFLGVFALGQYIHQGNYNFMAPYKPEIALGTPLLLLLADLCAGRKIPILLGALAGALILTSSEIALAAGGMLAVTALSFRSAFPFARILIGAAVPIASVTGFFLSREIDFTSACSATFRAIEILFFSKLVMAHDLKELMGIDLPLLRLGKVLASFLVFSVWVLGHNLALKRTKAGVGRPFILSALVLGPSVVIHALDLTAPFWLTFPKLLTLVPITGLLIWKKSGNLIIGILAAMSFGLLIRMFLNPMLHYYGFSLALGATLLLFPILHEFLPMISKRLGNDFNWTLGLALCCALVTSAMHLRAPFFEHKTYAVSEGTDPVLDWEKEFSARGPAIKELVSHLRNEVQPGDTILGLPDGHLVNYLLRTARPQPFNLSLGELKEFGEATILQSFQKSRPRYVFVAAKESHEDFDRFPEEYGASILEWVKREYRLVKIFGPGKIELYESGQRSRAH